MDHDSAENLDNNCRFLQMFNENKSEAKVHFVRHYFPLAAPHPHDSVWFISEGMTKDPGLKLFTKHALLTLDI